jgi:transposase
MLNTRNWRILNKKYVREGLLIFSPASTKSWALPKTKGRGRPFVYSNGLIKFAAQIRSITRAGFRQLQGVLEAIKSFLPIPKVADYTTLWRRVIRLGTNLKIESSASVVILDSTGMSKQERSFHLGQKWRQRRNFIKLHFAVDETGKVLMSRVTPEKGGGDATIGERMLSKLDAEKVLADGAYDTKNIFKLCHKKGIVPGIPIRKNANPKPLANPLRASAIKEQRRDMEKWGEKVGYKDRWTVERAFSAFKRRFGDATRAKKYHQASINNMVETFRMLQSV